MIFSLTFRPRVCGITSTCDEHNLGLNLNKTQEKGSQTRVSDFYGSISLELGGMIVCHS
jgi:hypothetical protein